MNSRGETADVFLDCLE